MAIGKMRNMFGRPSLGIEVTDRSVKWLEIRAGRKGPPLLVSMDLEPLPADAVEEGRLLSPGAVLQALERLVARNGRRRRHVHLVFPGSLTMVRHLKVPDVKMKHLKKMIDYELKYNIPLPFEQFIYDFIKIPAKPANGGAATGSSQTGLMGNEAAHSFAVQASPMGGGGLAAHDPSDRWDFPGSSSRDQGMEEAAVSAAERAPVRECEVMVVAAERAMIEHYAQLMRRAGLRLSSIENKALSLFRVVELAQPIDPDSTFVMVDLTPTHADVAIYHDGSLRVSRHMPIRFPAVQGGDPESLQAAEFAFRLACQELASEMERLINFYQFSLNNRDHEITHLLLSGDVDNVQGVIDELANRLPLEVFPLDPDQAVRRKRGNAGEEDGALRRFAAPLGSSLRGRRT